MTVISDIAARSFPNPWRRLQRYLPGVLTCAVVSAGALCLGRLETAVFGKAWLEPLVLAILLGAAVRLIWSPGARWLAGIDFSARTLLEIAIVLLGASVSGATLSALGPVLIAGVAVVVVVAIGIGFAVGRLLGLAPRLALLTACGNAICGNSAIAAIAPVIDADGEEVAASIAFTAALGVLVVLALPLLGAALGLAAPAYGLMAGLTVYAVPQVLAAAAPFGAVATQTGTVVKLVRVLMLGPVVVALSLTAGRGAAGNRPRLGRLMPWFIVGFLAMMGLRLCGLLPHVLLPILAGASSVLTVMAMAGLGLQTQIHAIARSGGRVVLAGVLSLAALIGLSLALIRLVA